MKEELNVIYTTMLYSVLLDYEPGDGHCMIKRRRLIQLVNGAGSDLQGPAIVHATAVPIQPRHPPSLIRKR